MGIQEARGMVDRRRRLRRVERKATCTEAVGERKSILQKRLRWGDFSWSKKKETSNIRRVWKIGGWRCWNLRGRRECSGEREA